MTATAARPLTPARVVFALLVLSCFGAFFLTQHLKHSPTLVQNFMMDPYFAPPPLGHDEVQPFSFKMGRADTVTVQIVNSAGTPVATVQGPIHLLAYTTYYGTWNGLTGPASKGPPAPQGTYRIRVNLRDAGKPVTSLQSFKLVRHPKHPVHR